MGEGTLGSPRDPKGGGPVPPMGGEPLGAQEVPWEGTLGEPFGGPRTNLEVFGDGVTFQEFLKSLKTKMSKIPVTENCEHGSQKIVHHFPAHFRLVKTPSIAIWSIILFGEAPMN